MKAEREGEEEGGAYSTTVYGTAVYDTAVFSEEDNTALSSKV